MISIERFMENEFQDYSLYGNPPTDYRIDCPFCSKRHGSQDVKKKLYVSINKEACHCFRCGYSNSWLGFVREVKNVSTGEALRLLCSVPRVRDFKRLFQPKEFEKQDVQLPKDFLHLNKTDRYIPHKNYLRHRGFGSWFWSRYNLGVADSVPNRVIIPIENGYWQGRAIFSQVEPKYLNPKTESRYHIFNGEALEKYDEVVICEGAFSAMAVGEHAIALVGKEGVEEKLRRLIDSEVQHFAITVEPNAYKTIGKLAKSLDNAGKEVTLWIYREGDPADNQKFEIMKYSFSTHIGLNMEML